mmetsp:Transcript_3614/g.9047  ORF Transcript_3614/g.9047 Transcript_3614/m.9047 type:complete len:217 (-) Transcript_3614:179-829(-)
MNARLHLSCVRRHGVGSVGGIGIRRVRAGVSSRRRMAADAVGLFFSTTTGHTEEAAEMIKSKWSGGIESPAEIADVDASSLAGFDGLVVGAPTWNTGADEMRSGTAWDDVLADIRKLNLKGKKVAVFGCGDSLSYGDYFCDAIEEVHSSFKAAGATMVGEWKVDGSSKNHTYEFGESKSCKGKVFLGLPLDYDNEDDLSEPRIKEWVDQLKKEGLK